MNVALSRVSMQLGQRQFLQLTDAAGMSISCIEGCLWITQHGDSRDIVVRSHESFVLDRPGLAVIQALTDSIVGLREPMPAESRAQTQILKPPDARRRFAWTEPVLHSIRLVNVEPTTTGT